MSKSNAKATLGGTVWNDVNHDGIQNDGNIGLAGIRVILLNSAGKSAGKYTFTDADGNYSFAGLNAGNYSVKFDKASLPVGATFSADHEGENANIDSDANYLTGKTGIIHLNAGQINNSVDAGIMLPQAASVTISGHSWSDVNGNGIHEVSEPAYPNVTINIFKLNAISFPELVLTTTTDSNGAYSYTGSEPGLFSAKVSTSPMYELTLDHRGSDQTMDSDFGRTSGDSHLITLAAGESRTSLDVGIVLPNQIQPSTVNGHVWKDVNSNGIQDPGEPGLARVMVNVSDNSGMDSGALPGGFTDSNGDYVITGIAPGEYNVKFWTGNISGSGYTTITTPHQGTNPNLDSDYNPSLGSTNNLITIHSNDTIKFDIGFAKDPLINLDAIKAVWLDADGNSLRGNATTEPGIEGITVTLISIGADGVLGGSDDTTVASTMTNANGDWHITNVEDVSYFVQFSKPGSTIQFSPSHDDRISRGDIISDSDVSGGGFASLNSGNASYTGAGIISIVGTPAALTDTLVA